MTLAAPGAATRVAPSPGPSSSGSGARTLSRVGLALPVLVILLALAWALFPALFTGQSPTDTVAPSLQAPSAEHWFGTDATGRDLYARVVYGASQSIVGALVAVLVGLVVGTAMGLAAGAIDHREPATCPKV